MLVRLNVGRKAGEIQDIEPSAAKQMLADGRARVAEYDQGSTEAEGVAKLAAVTDCHSEQREESAVADSTKPAKAAKKK